MQEHDLKQIAKQLRCPSGEFGVQMGRGMAKSNKDMTNQTIEQMDIHDGEWILELGHGIGDHLAQLLDKAADIHYQGLEISPLMHDEAIQLNKSLLAYHDIRFSLYDGRQLPFKTAAFDKVLTVNTLYFWSPAKPLMDEIARVLKPNGLAFITFAQKQFMKALPFVADEFQLYDNQDLAKLVNNSPLKIIEFIEKNDWTKSKSGQMVDREYTVAVLQRQA